MYSAVWNGTKAMLLQMLTPKGRSLSLCSSFLPSPWRLLLGSVSATQSLTRGIAAGERGRLAELWCWACVRLCHYLLAHIFSSNDRRIDDERTHAARYISGSTESYQYVPLLHSAFFHHFVLWICKWNSTIDNTCHLSICRPTSAGKHKQIFEKITKNRRC